MECASCNAEAPDTSRFCPQCGAMLPQAVTFATRTVAATVVAGPASEPGAAGNPSRDRFVPGTLISGRYRIVSILGKGGMGEVYRADDLTLGQSVALKFLPESLAGNPEAVNRFRNEVRIARQVTHPNVCRVHDLGDVQGQFFLSMEYVDGEDLASLLRRIGRLPEDKALEIARKLCAGLAAAHEKGILHRDLKPGNIMLDGRGQVLLTDFGLSGIAEELGANDIRSGTPAYMSPEQLAGKEVTLRSDLYALGLVLYELFTGKRPFEGNSIADLIAAQQANTPPSISSVTRDLDPAVERIIARCLDPEPARRPASALIVSAALPGGDPLAAALAAGETPSPELVAAAGEDTGLNPRIAIPLAAALLIAVFAHAWISAGDSMLDRARPSMSPDVLRYRARQAVRTLGYPAGLDSADGFRWGRDLIDWAVSHDRKPVQWTELARGRAPVLRYWYRESPESLSGSEFHDDLLTLGLTTPGDPPGITSGMIYVELDPQGRLTEFRAMPAQKVDQPVAAAGVNWAPLFAAAGVDASALQPDAPRWNHLEAADTRVAWTGVWPGSKRPLRIEAAALGGKPVAFTLMGPWTEAGRMPAASANTNPTLILFTVIAVVVLGASVWLAYENVRLGRGDPRGAFRLGVFMFCALMVLWLARMHFTGGMGLMGYFFVNVATATFYGILVWTVYLALEPFVRRYWPRTLISWTRILGGRIQDGAVGRDILVGAAVSCCWRLLSDIRSLYFDPNRMPNLPSEGLLLSARGALGDVLKYVPHAIRDTLLLFFAIFLLRLLLRKEWLGAVAFTLLLTGISAWSGTSSADLVLTVLVYGSFAFITMRFGLLALASLVLMDGALGDLPASFDTAAWYFPHFIAIVLAACALILWALRQSIAGQFKLSPVRRRTV
jgi:serine/threonine-protein kinase